MMADDEQQLLEQIRAQPADDRLRLAYADRLLARGDARGEYIQLTVIGARSPEQTRRKDALENLCPAWEAELGLGAFPSVRWDRGFPRELWGDADTFAAHPEVLRKFPIVAIAITNQRKYAALAALPELAFVDELTLSGKGYPSGWGMKKSSAPDTSHQNALPTEELAALGGSPHFLRLRKLTIHPRGLLDESSGRILASARWFGQIESFTSGFVGGEAFAQMLARPLPRLRVLELSIQESFLGEVGGRAFAEAELPGLESATFYKAGLGTGTRWVLGSHNLATMLSLSVVDDDAHGLGEVIARSPYTRALRGLELRSTGFGSADVIALATGNEFPELRSLGLSSNGIDDAAAAMLANSTRFPRLASLRLDHNRLTRDGALTIANRTGLPALNSLGLFGNPFPSGKTEPYVYDENQYVIDGGDIPIPFEDIKALFAHDPELQVS
jgi:uncharacterized protein (TIGR02996 family)